MVLVGGVWRVGVCGVLVWGVGGLRLLGLVPLLAAMVVWVVGIAGRKAAEEFGEDAFVAHCARGRLWFWRRGVGEDTEGSGCGV